MTDIPAQLAVEGQDTGVAVTIANALKPFADLADYLDEQPDPRWQNPHDEFQCGDFPYSIGVGQLHAARQAYDELLQVSRPQAKTAAGQAEFEALVSDLRRHWLARQHADIVRGCARAGFIAAGGRLSDDEDGILLGRSARVTSKVEFADFIPISAAVELAIAEVTASFSDQKPTPGMISFARAVAAISIAKAQGEA